MSSPAPTSAAKWGSALRTSHILTMSAPILKLPTELKLAILVACAHHFSAPPCNRKIHLDALSQNSEREPYLALASSCSAFRDVYIQHRGTIHEKLLGWCPINKKATTGEERNISVALALLIKALSSEEGRQRGHLTERQTLDILHSVIDKSYVGGFERKDALRSLAIMAMYRDFHLDVDKLRNMIINHSAWIIVQTCSPSIMPAAQSLLFVPVESPALRKAIHKLVGLEPNIALGLFYHWKDTFNRAYPQLIKETSTNADETYNHIRQQFEGWRYGDPKLFDFQRYMRSTAQSGLFLRILFSGAEMRSEYWRTGQETMLTYTAFREELARRNLEGPQREGGRDPQVIHGPGR